MKMIFFFFFFFPYLALLGERDGQGTIIQDTDAPYEFFCGALHLNRPADATKLGRLTIQYSTVYAYISHLRARPGVWAAVLVSRVQGLAVFLGVLRHGAEKFYRAGKLPLGRSSGANAVVRLELG